MPIYNRASKKTSSKFRGSDAEEYKKGVGRLRSF